MFQLSYKMKGGPSAPMNIAHGSLTLYQKIGLPKLVSVVCPNELCPKNSKVKRKSGVMFLLKDAIIKVVAPVTKWPLTDRYCRRRGILAQKFNRRTNVEPCTTVQSKLFSPDFGNTLLAVRCFINLLCLTLKNQVVSLLLFCHILVCVRKLSHP